MLHDSWTPGLDQFLSNGFIYQRTFSRILMKRILGLEVFFQFA